MIKHVVCFKLKDNSKENMDKTKKVLLSMRDNVALLRGIEVGANELSSNRSYDIILICLFDNFDALNDYQNDAYHVNVVKKHMHEVMESSVSVDYTL